MKIYIPLFTLTLGILIPVTSILTSIINIDEYIVLILNGFLIGLSYVLVDWVKERTPIISVRIGIIMITIGVVFFIGVTSFLLFSPVSSWQ